MMRTALWRRLVDGRDEDLVPQVVAWAIALSIGTAWLALVYLSPTTVRPAPRVIAADSSKIWFMPGSQLTSGDGSNGIRTVAVSTKRPFGAPQIAVDVAAAFAATTIGRKVVRDVSGLIDHVEAVGAITSTILSGDKTALAPGNAHAMPGGVSKFGPGSAALRRGIGTVAHGEVVQRAEVHMQTLAVMAAAAPDGGTIDPTVAGTFVRARAAQLQYCYERVAGGTDSNLAGVVTLRLILGANGVVRDAEVVRRTWSGPAAAETEACLLAAARRWQLPSASDGATVTLPISFTRGR